jgi:hypothetical protein
VEEIEVSANSPYNSENMSLCFSTYVLTYVSQTADLLSGCSPYIPPHPYYTHTPFLPSSFLTTYNRLPRQSVQTKTPDIPDFTFVFTIYIDQYRAQHFQFLFSFPTEVTLFEPSIITTSSFALNLFELFFFFLCSRLLP